MEMIIPNHSICYFYYDFSVFVFIILFGSIRKSCHTALFCLLLILSIISTAFAVCILKKIHRSSVFLFRTFYP